MKRRTSRLLSTLLALCMVPALLPAPAQAVESSLQDWYFLFAIFKNVDADCADGKGTTTHTKYTMSREEADAIRGNAKAFEEYMNRAGVIRAHVDIVEIDATVTELSEADGSGSYIAAELAAPFLEKVGVDLDRYDHVTCVVSLNVATKYVGITGSEFENGSPPKALQTKDFSQFTHPLALYDFTRRYPCCDT